MIDHPYLTIIAAKQSEYFSKVGGKLKSEKPIDHNKTKQAGGNQWYTEKAVCIRIGSEKERCDLCP